MRVDAFECDVEALEACASNLRHLHEAGNTGLWTVKFGYSPGKPNRGRRVPRILSVQPDGYVGSHGLAFPNDQRDYDSTYAHFEVAVEVSGRPGELAEAFEKAIAIAARGMQMRVEKLVGIEQCRIFPVAREKIQVEFGAGASVSSV